MIDRKYKETVHTDTNQYEYITVTQDENKVRIYTLKNGLKVFLAQNSDAPRIQTFIPVRTGSNNDPADNTGLAHYLEHMMFKELLKSGLKTGRKKVNFWIRSPSYMSSIRQSKTLKKRKKSIKK